jgi:hypothetical protein
MCVFCRWTFRSRELTPFFTVIPTLRASGQCILPPIYSVEMNAKEFNNLDYKEWHIGIVRNLLHFMLKPCMLLVVVPLDNPTQMAVWILT